MELLCRIPVDVCTNAEVTQMVIAQVAEKLFIRFDNNIIVSVEYSEKLREETRCAVVASKDRASLGVHLLLPTCLVLLFRDGLCAIDVYDYSVLCSLRVEIPSLKHIFFRKRETKEEYFEDKEIKSQRGACDFAIITSPSHLKLCSFQGTPLLCMDFDTDHLCACLYFNHLLYIGNNKKVQVMDIGCRTPHIIQTFNVLPTEEEAVQIAHIDVDKDVIAFSVTGVPGFQHVYSGSTRASSGAQGLYLNLHCKKMNFAAPVDEVWAFEEGFYARCGTTFIKYKWKLEVTDLGKLSQIAKPEVVNNAPTVLGSVEPEGFFQKTKNFETIVINKDGTVQGVCVMEVMDVCQGVPFKFQDDEGFRVVGKGGMFETL